MLSENFSFVSHHNIDVICTKFIFYCKETTWQFLYFFPKPTVLMRYVRNGAMYYGVLNLRFMHKYSILFWYCYYYCDFNLNKWKVQSRIYFLFYVVIWCVNLLSSGSQIEQNISWFVSNNQQYTHKKINDLYIHKYKYVSENSFPSTDFDIHI